MTQRPDLSRLEHEGGRNKSRQRAQILSALRGTTSHPTAVELFDMVRERLPRVTLATVYRNLRVLEELGLVRELAVGPASRFDATTRMHSHVRCTVCGRVDDIDVALPQGIIQQGNLNTSYEVTSCDLTFEGLCPECQRRSAADNHTEGREK